MSLRWNGSWESRPGRRGPPPLTPPPRGWRGGSKSCPANSGGKCSRRSERHRDRLGLEEVLGAFVAVLAAPAGLLEAAERHRRIDAGRAVDRHRAGLQLLGQLVG